MDRTIDAAVEFLLIARAGDGWWEDFQSTRGPSDEWVTAYVAAALAAVPRAPAVEAARRAWRLLKRRRRWSGGWGYNPWAPADADSTQWALRLAAALGDRSSTRVRRGRRFLRGRLRPSGGLATYAPAGLDVFFLLIVRNVYDALHALATPGGPDRFRAALAGYLRRRGPSSYRGWAAAHTCVTAAAAGLVEINRSSSVRAYLRRTQAPDGSWDGYWWSDREYTTALAAEALSMNVQPEDRSHIRAAAGWAERRVGPDGAIRSALCPDGSPFATAWCLRLLLLGADEDGWSERVEGCVDWLSRQQRADGSWPPSAWFRVPPPDLLEPEALADWIVDGRGYGTVRVDQNAVFTTATVAGAIQLAAARRPERQPVRSQTP